MPAPKELKRRLQSQDEPEDSSQPPSHGFAPGDQVRAKDRGNLGTVDSVNGDRVTVRFLNRKTGKERVRTFNSRDIEPKKQKSRAKKAEESERAGGCPALTKPDLPTIVISVGQLPDLTDKALAALTAANTQSPSIFERGGRPVRILIDERGSIGIETLTEASLRGSLARSADWVREGRKGALVDTMPPLAVVQDILSSPERPFPPLAQVIETPTIRQDGAILSAPGYDASTRLYYAAPNDFRLPTLPANPTREHAAKAVAFLVNELLVDFPFENQGSQANAIALMLTAVLLPSLSVKAPLALIDAPQQGTGKSLLASLIVRIATGRPAVMMTAPNNPKSADDEWRKKITAILSAGTGIAVFDNVDGQLDSPSLAAVLTSEVWSDRLLGKSEQLTLQSRTCWICTGNNLKPVSDLPRRCYWIRLNAGVAKPFLRSGFRHAAIEDWVQGNRGELIAALLCMARAWFVAGKPRAKVPDLGSFEAWTRIIGGILEFAGVQGFLENAAELLDGDEEQNEWGAFFAVWAATYSDAWITVSKIADDVCNRSMLRESLPIRLQEILEKNSASSFKKVLGKQLSKRVGVVYSGGFSLFRKQPNTKQIGMLWRVVDTSQGLKNGRNSQKQTPTGQVIEFPSYTENVGVCVGLVPITSREKTKDGDSYNESIGKVMGNKAPKSPKPPTLSEEEF